MLCCKTFEHPPRLIEILDATSLSWGFSTLPFNTFPYHIPVPAVHKQVKNAWTFFLPSIELYYIITSAFAWFKKKKSSKYIMHNFFWKCIQFKCLQLVRFIITLITVFWLIYFKILFIVVMAYLNFQQPLLQSSVVTWSCRNHSNMLMWCVLYDQYCKQLLLNIFWGNCKQVKILFQDTLIVQKKSKGTTFI